MDNYFPNACATLQYSTLYNNVLAAEGGGESAQTHPGSSDSHIPVQHYYLMFYTSKTKIVCSYAKDKYKGINTTQKP